MPTDLWGAVYERRHRPDGLVDLTIRDDSGRVSRVFGIDPSHIESVSTGDRVWLFGLGARRQRIGTGRWKHPVNFFEIADDDPFARAWSLEVFRE
jgi:hypothetical protein